MWHPKLPNSMQSYVIYGLVAFVLLLPLLKPGFILTLDMIFTPKLAMPETVTSSYLFRAGLHVLNLAIPSDVIEKLILFTILTLSGLGMHRLVSSIQLPDTPVAISKWAAYASGLVYMINSFTYSRFMAGQYSVLLGYALLPFFVVALLRFLKEPSVKKTTMLVTVTVAISIVSIHTLGLAFVVALVALLQAIWHYRANTGQLKKIAIYGVTAGLIFVVASSYWLLPLIQGNGTTATSIATFRNSDQSEFATGGDGVGGKLMHVLRLQGFWGERNNLFLLPQDAFNMWGLAVLAIWILIIIGIVTAWRRKRDTSILLISIAAIAALLAAGVGTTWLVDCVPFFAGFREPQKFVGLIALSYAVLIGFGISKLLSKFNSKVGLAGIGIIFTIVLVGFTPVMFLGFNGQLVPRQYPADWYSVNQKLNEDKDTYRVLFLPWHLYMRFQFAERLIANPGDDFFDKPLLVSDDPELGNVGPAVINNQKQLLTTHILPQAAKSNTLGQKLAPLQVKYVLLSKDSDYKTYGYLDHQTDLQLVTESTTLKLYRNTAFGKANK